MTQAWRQPGSSFKPFIYSAALEKGLGPATIINDAPLFFRAADDRAARRGSRRTTTAARRSDDRCALALQKSKNLVSIRILNRSSAPSTRKHYVTQRFGFDADKTPPYLPMALGAGLVTPLQMAGAYSVFANGGYRINPYLIAK